MKKHLALTFYLFSGCLLLAGCTDADWDHVMNYGGLQDADAAQADAPQRMASQPQAADAPTPATLAAAPSGEPANAGFCRNVATQDATHNDFDPATQQRVYARSYAQCVSMYTR